MTTRKKKSTAHPTASLPAFAEEALGKAEMARVREHVLGCQDRIEVMEDLRLVSAALDSEPAAPVSDALRDRILMATLGKSAEQILGAGARARTSAKSAGTADAAATPRRKPIPLSEATPAARKRGDRRA